MMRAHARKCPNISVPLREAVFAEAGGAEKENVSQAAPNQLPGPHVPSIPTTAPSMSTPTPSVRPLKRQKTSNPAMARTAAQQAEFAEDTCNLFLTCNIPWSAADNPEFHYYIGKYVGEDVDIPGRRALAGSILNREVKKVEMRTKERTEGKLATGQCDGWKNIAKTSVVTSIITVEYEAYLLKTHDMTGNPKSGEFLYELIIKDIEHAEEKFGVLTIAWVTDGGPDGAKARRLLRTRKPRLITIHCWGHQIGLTVGDYMDLDLPYLTAVSEALEIIKWFNNHSVALDWFNREQELKLNKILALISPVISRWTAYYLTLTRLKAVETPLRTCCITNRAALIENSGNLTKNSVPQRRKVESVLTSVNNEEFWSNISIIITHLEPLAIAANIAQAAHTRLDHVLLMFGNLFRIFSNPEVEEAVRVGLLASFERRWAQTVDQEVYILAVFFNPYIRSRCFNSEVLTHADLFDMARRVFERVFEIRVDGYFLEAFTDYYCEDREFSSQRMNLEFIKELYDMKDEEVDLLLVWRRLNPDSNSPRNGIKKLAIHLLSVVANSAGCERAFSQFGITHTKLRNRLSAEKVHKMNVVKMARRRAHIEAGLIPPRLKRKFNSDSYYPTTDSPPANQSEPARTAPDTDLDMDGEDSDSEAPDNRSFAEFREDLRSEARDARSNDDDDDDLPESVLTSRELLVARAAAFSRASDSESARTRAPVKTRIPLKDLFKYPSHGDNGTELDFYWKGGIRNLQRELASMDAAAAAEHFEETQTVNLGPNSS